jgi:uncharacterized OB-fold protein
MFLFRAPPRCDHENREILLFEPELKDAFFYKRCLDCGSVYVFRESDCFGVPGQWSAIDRAA